MKGHLQSACQSDGVSMRWLAAGWGRQSSSAGRASQALRAPSWLPPATMICRRWWTPPPRTAVKVGPGAAAETLAAFPAPSTPIASGFPCHPRWCCAWCNVRMLWQETHQGSPRQVPRLRRLQVSCARRDVGGAVGWAADLVFIQNGMLQPWLDERGLGQNTQASSELRLTQFFASTPAGLVRAAAHNASLLRVADVLGWQACLV